MKQHIIICFSMMFLLLGCNETDIHEVEPEKSTPISMQIKTESTVEGRALVDNTKLQEACTPGVGNQSVGVWGEYTLEGTTETVFDNTMLYYDDELGNNDEVNGISWNYENEQLWVSDATYLFRACFPQARMSSLMTEITPSILQGRINTTTIQEDILVASAYVDTKTANLSFVPLNLKHIFAALRFSAKAEEGYDPDGDAVTSCWLQNQSEATNLFSTSGYLVYSGIETSTIVWYKDPSIATPMYTWEHSNGLTFNDQENTLLYTDNSQNIYTSNDGWLLVVPQTVEENSLKFCYTLKNTPGEVFSSTIPAIEYLPGYKYSYVLMIGGANATLTLTIAPWNQLDSSHNIDL